MSYRNICAVCAVGAVCVTREHSFVQLALRGLWVAGLHGLRDLRNTVILRTDYQNSIKISSNGNDFNVYSYDSHDTKYKLKEQFSTVVRKNQPND